MTAFVDDRGEKSIPYLLCGEDEIEVQTRMKEVLQAPGQRERRDWDSVLLSER